MTTSPESPARPTSPTVDFRTVDLRGRRLSLAELREAVPRARHETVADAEQKVGAIITDVRERGYAALTELALRFDGVEQVRPRVSAEALQSALTGLDPAVRSAWRNPSAVPAASLTASAPATWTSPWARAPS